MGLFAPARKATAKARIGLAGPTGSGKTFTALRLARGLAGPDGTIAVIDTEHGSAALYADLFGFDVAVMNPPYSPSKYRMAIGEAADAGYAVLIIDSITHAWNGTGGVLEIVDEEAKRQRGNKFAAWAVGSEEWKELLDTILGAPMHAIVTMRSKMEYVQQENSRGKTEVVKVGMAPEARDGIEYEFTVVGDLDHRHSMVVSKSRIAAFADRVVDKPGEQVGADIRAWLTEGEPDPTEQAFRPAPDVTPEPTSKLPPAPVEDGQPASLRAVPDEGDPADDAETAEPRPVTTDPVAEYDALRKEAFLSKAQVLTLARATATKVGVAPPGSYHAIAGVDNPEFHGRLVAAIDEAGGAS